MSRETSGCWRGFQPVLVCLLAIGFCASEGRASGIKLKLKSDGYGDGYFYTLDLPTGSHSRYITEYSPGDTDPHSLITRARIALANAGETDGSHFIADLRTEDPLNPGFPMLHESGLIAVADPNSFVGCLSGQRWTDYFTFGGGAGIPAPVGRFFLTVVAPEGQQGVNACGIQMDTSSPPTGAAKYYLSGRGVFSDAPWNHLAEIEVFESGLFDVQSRWHGSIRYPGDSGRPVLFAVRPSETGTTDDFISVSINIDNHSVFLVRKKLGLAAARDILSLGRGFGWKDLTKAFRTVSGGKTIPNPLALPPGRTHLRLEFPRPIPARFVDQSPMNPTFRVELSDANNLAIEDFEEDIFGIRPKSGEPDDDSGESLFLVQSPTVTNDALAVRFPAIDMPTTASYRVSAIQLVGGELGGSDFDGFDAVEIRLEDPIVIGPDLSPAGLLRQVGLADGQGEIRMGPVMTVLTLDIPDLDVDPVNSPIGNLWAQVLLNPGDTILPNFGTFLGSDGTGNTLMTDSFFTSGSVNHYSRDIAQNYMIRLLLDGRKEPMDGGSARAVDDDMRLPPGGFITSGDWIQVNIEAFLSLSGGR